MITFEAMKAIIFSAGLGTRLKQHTENCPKALVEINGRPLLWHAIQKLTQSGVRLIVVNVHHFGDQIINYIQQNHFDVPVLISDERNELLDTGGGLQKAASLLKGNEPIIAYNVDILSSIDLNAVVYYHSQNKALATLVVRNRQTSRYLMFDPAMQLSGWINKANNDHIITSPEFGNSQALAFSGIQILSPQIFEHISETGKFPIIQLYLRLSKTEKIIAFNDESDFWLDAGRPEHLIKAEEWINRKL